MSWKIYKHIFDHLAENKPVFIHVLQLLFAVQNASKQCPRKSATFHFAMTKSYKMVNIYCTNHS